MVGDYSKGPDIPSDQISEATSEGRDHTSEDRDRTSEDRDHTSEDRDHTSEDRDLTSEDRDLTSEGRDLTSEGRDRMAEDRDRMAAKAGADRRGPLPGRREADMRAAADRASAASDRELAAADRASAAADREAALGSRRGGASDRSQALGDREAASEDRVTSARDREASSIDELTGAHRREAGLVELEREIARVKRTKQPFVLAFVDVDSLKATNDSLGHAAGDELLRRVVDALRAHFRVYDLIVRYGGDEFVCSILDLSRAEAAKRFALIDKELSAAHQASVTVGLAELKQDDSLAGIISRADKALYKKRRRRPSTRA